MFIFKNCTTTSDAKDQNIHCEIQSALLLYRIPYIYMQVYKISIYNLSLMGYEFARTDP